ncbi:unnamed protein product [Caenorhabditis angaria]|uniref:F-box domain-containing protein n=1 Tax=Caenorhabditis angaria TaxID=860376 RepID=A0A9P1I9J4_9PELO|nr:unnamed protein product [Caenorhabditis angaria]
MPRKRKIVADDSWREDDSLIGWFDLPLEMREMVINKMDIKTRCKFMQCSKKCEEEVEISKNFLTTIKILACPLLGMKIGFGEPLDEDMPKYDYCLEFKHVFGLDEPRTDVVYYCNIVLEKYEDESYQLYKKDVKWTKTEYGEPKEVRMKYLKELMKKYWKTIERFEIHDRRFDSNFDIKQLKNLKCLISCNDVRENGLMDISQIYKLKECYTNSTEFTFEEVLHFEGTDYLIKSDCFNQENFEMYLKMVKNGEVHRNLKYLRVSSNISSRNNLNSKKLAKTLDAFDFFGENDKLFQFNFVLEKSYPKSICFVVHYEYSFVVKISSDYYDGIIEYHTPLDF